MLIKQKDDVSSTAGDSVNQIGKQCIVIGNNVLWIVKLGEWYPDWIVEQPIYHDAGSNEIRNGCVIELHVIPSLGNIYLLYVHNIV